MNVIAPTPYEAQLPVLKACFDKTTTFIVTNGSRQVGKTFLSTIAAVKWALDETNQNIMIVSPTDSQVKKLYKQTIAMLMPLLEHIKSYKIQSGDSEIVFKNGSVILFRSALSENTLRGYSNTHLILDECAFIKEETWNMILAPTLLVKGKKCLFCSTPKGNNFFARLYHQGLEPTQTKYKSFKLTYQQNPFANQEFIEEQRLILPDEIFRQEYLGEFIDAAGVFRDIDKIAVLPTGVPNRQESYYIGVDIAFKKDYTVAICFNSKLEMVDMVRFNNTDIGYLINTLKAFFLKWNAKRINIESNNQGLPVIQQLRREGVNTITEFVTSATSKPLIISQLIAAVGKKEVKFLNQDIIKSEFNAFTATIGKTGHVKYEGAYGNDDIVMATSIAFEAALKHRYVKAFAIG